MFKNFYLPLLAIIFFCASCVKSSEFDAPQSSCEENLQANGTFAQVKALYQGELLQIQDDLIIEGYVVSSDRAGNFFSVLHFQDAITNPTEGFQIEIDLRQSYLLFEPGSKVLIKLKGLYLGQSRDVFKLGGTFAGFGTVSVGRLPALQIPEHIFLSCDEIAAVTPTTVAIENLAPNFTNTLVQIENVELVEEDLGQMYALELEETERTLVDCSENEIIMLNSGFSDFQEELLPEGNGSITGVLLRENDDYFLAIRDLNDIDFFQERCEETITTFTSTSVFISELADPNNNAGARFVELYNSASAPLNLNGWTLRRYTNANTDVSSTIDLSNFTIEAESTLVISPNVEEFELVYGFAPDLGVGTNSPADSNGDDNLELVDPFGTVIDIFGVVGEDGSGTNHEFEDGRAVRNSNIVQANNNYTFSEWIIFNDSGDSSTINEPQNAPEDFTPGVRD
ncbi:DUF5689 domain-containing protein [Croceitalea rosinachiae]|uniref:DUF5689 domain-containing protein n=1 Tax=Croceitalea rosinachiae TaxID=3075596 RepID=A0ABU3A8M2_9FLAO|nr:DUF5689 domain-containing protein [Croceitalea sp. F388]MDT0606537.1 DUF5689 domain-containing protein [Croceitalea sp. F388]